MDMEPLEASFRTLFTGPPSWAWPLDPSIPFVGTRYQRGRSLLIYASAENFVWMKKGTVPARYTDKRSWNRYRAAYEGEGRESSAFFPTVGIAPVSNGALLTAGAFVAERLRLPTRKTPRAFLETLAVTNWCKFTIKAGRNVDYLGDTRKLTASLPYVVAELATLRPKVALVPKIIWRHPILRACMRGATPYTRFLPVPQFNPRVVNIHLARFDDATRAIAAHSAGTTVDRWMSELKGFRLSNAWRYLAMLEGIATAVAP